MHEKGVSYRANYKFSGLVKTARELRKNQTPAEDVMWALLRNRQLADIKFRRQHQLGHYVVDFFCHELKLVVELDGEVHTKEAQSKKDHKRDAYMRSMGFTVLRFENQVFLNDPESVLKEILDSKLPSPARLPSPSGRGAGGEGVPADGIASLYTMIGGLFNPTTLTDVIRNFIYFPDTSRREEKILCRYPQYYAAKKLYQNILLHMRPDRKWGHVRMART